MIGAPMATKRIGCRLNSRPALLVAGEALAQAEAEGCRAGCRAHGTILNFQAGELAMRLQADRRQLAIQLPAKTLR